MNAEITRETQEQIPDNIEGSIPAGDESGLTPEELEQEKRAVRKLRRWNLLRGHRRLHFLRAALVGLFAGAIAVLFQKVLWSVEEFRGDALAYLTALPIPGWLIIPLAVAAIGAFAGWLTSRFAPSASGSGIPNVKAALLQLRPMKWQRLLPVKFVGGILAIGAGFSLGREGPTVQMGAAAGKMLSQLLNVPRRSRPQMIAAGAGAGLAAAFNAPLAGFIFVIEELRREISPLTYATALIAAVVGDIVTRTYTGQLPSFHVSGYSTPSLFALPLFALLGLVCAIAGVGFNSGLLTGLRFVHGLTNVPKWARAACVGLLVGLVLCFFPAAAGGGHHTAELILNGRVTELMAGYPAWLGVVGFVLLLFTVKFVLTLISYASGVPGGIFAPLLVLGALLGTFVGYVSSLWFPSMASNPAGFAVIGMAAMFAAVVRAPLTGIVLILEMTGNYQQLFALLVASLIAYLLADQLRNKPVYEALLDYDLQRGGDLPPEQAEPVIFDMVIEPHSELDGRRVRDMGLPKGCLLVTISRAGREVVPTAETELKPADQLTLIASGDRADACAYVQERTRAK